MSASETALAQLEACLTQVVQLLSSLQTENGELVEKIEKLKTKLTKINKSIKEKIAIAIDNSKHQCLHMPRDVRDVES